MDTGSLTTRILLIDGYHDDRQYWAERLRTSAEYLVLEAKTGAAGLALCRSHRIDCVITELNLPDLSGFQILVELIPLASKPQIPVIMLCRSGIPSLAFLAKKNGAQAYLVKSNVSGDDLNRVIHVAIAAVGPTGKEPRV